jgi:hypothetical protein
MLIEGSDSPEGLVKVRETSDSLGDIVVYVKISKGKIEQGFQVHRQLSARAYLRGCQAKRVPRVSRRAYRGCQRFQSQAQIWQLMKFLCILKGSMGKLILLQRREGVQLKSVHLCQA